MYFEVYFERFTRTLLLRDSPFYRQTQLVSHLDASLPGLRSFNMLPLVEELYGKYFTQYTLFWVDFLNVRLKKFV